MRYTIPRLRTFFYLCITIALAVFSFLMKDHSLILGYLGISCFTLAAIVFILQLLPGSNFLEFDDQILRYRLLFRNTDIPLHTIEEFVVIPLGDGKSERAGLRFIPDSLKEKSYDQLSADLMLPDNFGMNAKELVAILNTHLSKIQ